MAPKPPALPPPDDLPDRAHIFAAADEAAFERHFHEHGFVVVDGVLDADHISATVNELWECPSLLGGYPKIKRDEPETWGGDDWPAGCRNFLDSLDPCSERESWQNRVNPVIARVFEVLYHGLDRDVEEPSEGELVVSVDRFGVMRPARVRLAATEQQECEEACRTVLVERPEWRTSRNWLHWDQNPWSTPDFFAMQGLVGLSESSSTTGGFVTVPGFHREFRQWGKDHPEGSIAKQTSSMVPFPVPLTDAMQSRRVKVVVPAGALLVWDSRMPHENFPNEGETWRLVQYIMYKRLRPGDLAHRAEAWRASIRTGLVPAAFARSFSPEEWARLGMATQSEDISALEKALNEGEHLSPEAVEAARKLRRAYRLKQTAMDPLELREAKELFQAAFAVNPTLKEPLQRVAAAEDTYLPFWIL